MYQQLKNNENLLLAWIRVKKAQTVAKKKARKEQEYRIKLGLIDGELDDIMAVELGKR